MIFVFYFKNVLRELDEGLAEAVSSLIWIAPRMQTDVNELKLIGDQLTAKYGKPYGLACRENAVGTVSQKLMQKMSVQAPPKLLVEKYLIEISKIYSVDYEPDHRVGIFCFTFTRLERTNAWFLPCL